MSISFPNFAFNYLEKPYATESALPQAKVNVIVKEPLFDRIKRVIAEIFSAFIYYLCCTRTEVRLSQLGLFQGSYTFPPGSKKIYCTAGGAKWGIPPNKIGPFVVHFLGATYALPEKSAQRLSMKDENFEKLERKEKRKILNLPSVEKVISSELSSIFASAFTMLKPVQWFHELNDDKSFSIILYANLSKKRLPDLSKFSNTKLGITVPSTWDQVKGCYQLKMHVDWRKGTDHI